MNKKQGDCAARAFIHNPWIIGYRLLRKTFGRKLAAQALM
jgi:hypothetical protein